MRSRPQRFNSCYIRWIARILAEVLRLAEPPENSLDFTDMTTQTLSTGARLTPFLLDSLAPVGVLILPGGGYGALAVQHEGHAIGQWLNARGYDAWMLEYRVVSPDNPAPLLGKPLEDVGLALEAMRAQRRNEKLGVWGFSAGGHLAAMAATEPSFELDFAVLAYSVMDIMGSATHSGSLHNLLGQNPTLEQKQAYSPALRVELESPPMFLFHTADDGAVPPENSLLMAQALAAHRIPFALHIYQTGPHGVGLADGKMGARDLPAVAPWSGQLESWLKAR